MKWFCVGAGAVDSAGGAMGPLDSLKQQAHSSPQQLRFPIGAPLLTGPWTAKVWATVSSRLKPMANSCFTTRGYFLAAASEIFFM